MDSIIWPCRTSQWLPHILIIYIENFINLSNIFNLYYYNKMDFMDSIIWPCHTSQQPPHISLINKGKSLNFFNY